MEDLTLKTDVNRGLNQHEGVIVNQSGASVHGQEVGKEVLAAELQQHAKLHRMARDQMCH